MSHLIYALPVLACPIGMSLMMWLMMRGKNTSPESTGGEGTVEQRQSQLARLQAEIEALRRSQQPTSVGPVHDSVR